MTSKKIPNIACLLIEGYRGGCSSPIRHYGACRPTFDDERPLGGFRVMRILFLEPDAFLSDAHLFADTKPANETSFYENLLAKIHRGEPVAVASIINVLNKLSKFARTESAASRNDLSVLWQVIDHLRHAQNCAVYAAQSALDEICES